MRLPSDPDALENKTETVSRDPSYPDRARIDSDVRAFLRPVSTPWIVFDRDSRIDDFAKSALRVGAVFASSPSFRQSVISALEGAPTEQAKSEQMPLIAPPVMAVPAITDRAPLMAPDDAFRNGAVLSPAMVLPQTNMFPPSMASPESVVEPSNLVVATDVMSESSQYAVDDGRAALESDPFLAPPRFFSPGRIAAIAGAVLALVATSAVVMAGGARSHAKRAAAAHAVETRAVETPAPPPPVAPAVVQAPVAETVELDSVPAPPPPVTASEPANAGEPATSKAPTDPKKRFGKLTIKADAKYKNVYFDGKRMLGTGQRSFLVLCGMHTIAVVDKADTKDIEIPCSGEYVVAK